MGRKRRVWRTWWQPYLWAPVSFGGGALLAAVISYVIRKD